MIGQKELLARLSTEIKNDTFPRFSIIVGKKGSGKKLLARDVIPSMFPDSDIVYTLPDVKIETVREMIKQANKITRRAFYIIPDADNMSGAAKNALLKITEEPPRNAYFIMTLQDTSTTLTTILSRAVVIRMEEYSAQDIGDFYKENYEDSIDGIVLDVCETPGDVVAMKEKGIYNFYDFVTKVVDNIAQVSKANALKITSQMRLKATDEENPDKYDLALFWKCFLRICVQRMKTTNKKDVLRYADAIKLTSKSLQELRVTGINKTALFDLWILDIRDIWEKYYED